MRAAVLILSSMNAMLRETASSVWVAGVPSTVMLRYDVDQDGRALSRVTCAAGGVVQTAPRGLGACAICAVREDALEAVRDLTARGARSLVVVLPVTMSPRSLALAVQYSRAPIVLASSAVVLDVPGLPDDLLGADLLVDRGLNLGRDGRSVAEALSAQVETADLLLGVGALSASTDALLDHTAGTVPVRCDLHRVNAAAVLRRRRPARLCTRADLRLAAPTGSPDRDGVWTVDLHSAAALHPQRLLDRLAVLSSGRVRGRGYFWLPDAPALQYGWSSCGGRAQLEVLDTWADQPHTRLVVTGDDDSRVRIRAAFDSVLATDAELARDSAGWGARPEGLRRRIGARRYRCASRTPTSAD
jgi:G3E family GTPase